MSAIPIIPFSNLTGSTDDSYLDYWDGNDLIDGQMAFGIVAGHKYDYVLNATSSDTADGLFRIAPATNPGTKMWELVWTSKRVGASVSVSGQTVANGAWATLSWTSEGYDVGGFWAAGNPTKLIIPPGVKIVSANLRSKHNGSLTSEKRAIYNIQHYDSADTSKGSCWTEHVSHHGQGMTSTFADVDVVAGDYFTVDVYQASGGSRDYTSSLALTVQAFG